MRFVISIIAALMVLGLAAFGVVSAQKMSAAPSGARGDGWALRRNAQFLQPQA